VIDRLLEMFHFDFLHLGRSKRLRLPIELVPSPLWGRSLSHFSGEDDRTREIWGKIRGVELTRTGGRCEVCAEKAEVVHEKWEYDDEHWLQRLTGFEVLCRPCSNVHHLGFSIKTGAGSEVFERFVRINALSRNEAERLMKEAFELWEKRSAGRWMQDFGFLSQNAERYGLTADDLAHLEVVVRNAGKGLSGDQAYHEAVESELLRVPLIGYARAAILTEAGIRTVRELEEADPEVLRSNPAVAKSRDPSFPIQLPMVVEYARAVHEERVIVDGELALPPPDSVLVDLEYDPERSFVFVVGVMMPGGEVKQWFSENEKQEREAVEELIALCSKNTCTGYSLYSADLPTLSKSAARHGLSIEGLRFFDVFYDVLFTENPRRQRVYLPLKDMGLKSVSEFFGYREPPDIVIRDGLAALIAFYRFLRTKDMGIKEQILKYNRYDLERTALVLKELARLSKDWEKSTAWRQRE
jgi:hypothetical protein